ncbi:MAG: peptidase prepilin type [Candidatus Solibacter sp.]|nr:peptidase prepilin type [Candidatus Solibacter sp.]
MTMMWWAVVGLGVAASVEDFRTRHVPNWITVAGCLVGLALAAFTGWGSLGMALTGGALGFLVLLPLYLCGAMGGGDVKLMAAFGTLLGPMGILSAAVFCAAFGGAGALVARVRGARAIPYAPAIAAGVWMVLVGGSS